MSGTTDNGEGSSGTAQARGSPATVASSSGARPTHHGAGQPGKRPSHSVHINVKADPSERLAPAITPPRVTSWLPRVGGGAAPVGVSNGPTGRSPSSRMAYGRPSSPDGSGSVGLPPPVPSTPLKEHVAVYPTGGARGRFRQAVSNALRKLEVQAWRRGLFPADSARTFDRRTSSGGESIINRAWKLLMAVLGAFWISSSSFTSPAPRHHPSLSDAPDAVADEKPRTRSERAMAKFLDPARKRVGLSRLGFVLVLGMLCFGVWDGRSRTGLLASDSGIKAGSDAFKPLDRLGVLIERRSEPRLEVDDPLDLRGLWLYPHASDAPHKGSLVRGSVDADVTAVVLSWKRVENVKLVVAYLCRYDFFRAIVVWNNNADAPLSRRDFKSTHCPAHKLQIVNSPRNLFFLSRFLACASAATDHCYFQDDDWIVQPIRSMYSQYRRDREGSGLVVQTDAKTSLMYGWEWCFYNEPMNTCFAWLGTGAFISRAQVLSFLDLASSLPLPVDEMSLADNLFSTVLNAPPYVFAQPSLTQLASPQGFSDGSGLARNKHYIQRGIDRLGRLLGTRDFPTLPTRINPPSRIEMFSKPAAYPLPPHPYSHHVRAANPEDTASFLTNVAILPPPDGVVYPSSGNGTAGGTGADLTAWEERLGWIARGWVEGGELYADGERWALDWPYASAVDGDVRTAWRSPDSIKSDDYVGLALIAPARPSMVATVELHIMIEHGAEVLSTLALEISNDGFTWADPIPSSQSFTCRSTKRASRIPDLSFPDSPLLSRAARAMRESERAVAEGVSGWLRRRRRRAVRLQDCSIYIGTRWAEAGKVAGGWQFVRLRATKDLAVGWGVYELKLGGRIA